MELFDTYFVWFGQVLAVSGMHENVSHKSPMCIGGKITTVPRLFSEHLLQDENKHPFMNVNTKCNCLIPILSGLVKYCCFRDENVSHKSPMCIGGKITTVPRLFSEHLLQDENKHQIMNVQTKWNCLIPILSGLVKY